MARGVPFNETGFLAGISTAMRVGVPEREADQLVFVFGDDVSVTGSQDADEVPYDPAVVPTVVAGKRVRVLCAAEYLDARGQAVEFGIITPSSLRITLMDAEYQKVKGFAFVVAGGDKYLYRRTAPAMGMVTATVWTIYCVAEDET